MNDPIAAVSSGQPGTVARSAAPESLRALVAGNAGGGTPSSSSALQQATQTMPSLVVQGQGGAGAVDIHRQLGAVERSLSSASVKPQDFLRQTLVTQQLTMEVSARLTRLHLSTALAGSVTGLFNTLLKNRD